jgi:hypothetical protein
VLVGVRMRGRGEECGVQPKRVNENGVFSPETGLDLFLVL